MYRFTSEKRLFAWADLTLKDWIKNNANEYEEFEDMRDDIIDILPSVTTKKDTIDAMCSFLNTAHSSKYIASVVDSETVGCNTVSITTLIDRFYFHVMTDRFDTNEEEYRLLWEMNRDI